MILRKALPILLFVLQSFGSIAQNPADLPPGSAPFNLNGQSLKTFDNRHEGIRGTYLLQESFSSGTVALKKGQLKDAPINYDAYNDNVLAKKGDVVYQLRKDLITGFTFKLNNETVYTFISHEIDQRQTFLLVLSDSLAVYCKVTKVLKKAQIGGSYNTGQNNFDEFVFQNSYYVENAGKLISFKANKKGFVTALPDQKEKIENYLKQTKVDFNNYEEVMQMMQFITLK